ncbi:uncharacterized protein [Phyllobates terribilis]|uniref:uncharacterized protein isoform X2 n=1 Tax=Phyllobates terribilis TaxID=111132 RepID=UPI003CCA9C78
MCPPLPRPAAAGSCFHFHHEMLHSVPGRTRSRKDGEKQQNIMVGRQTVQIFSRSGEVEYRWLLDGLREEWTVSAFTITNSNSGAFCDQIYRCFFAILYHSRNRGRVNITDVTDSLYDDEVKSIFEVLGKERLIVVIDDLDDSSDVAKDRILTHQHSLRIRTQEIFLFTTEEKTNHRLLRRKMGNIKSVIANSVRPSPIEDDASPVTISLPGPARMFVISALSFLTLYNTYHDLNPRNGLLLVLWTAVTLRVLSIPVSKPVIPLGSRACFLLSSAMAGISIYDTCRRPSAPNVTGSVLWIISCYRYFLPRRQSSGLIWRLIPYGPMMVTFWKMWWWPSHVETTLQEISSFAVRSPAILAAEGI